MGRAPVAGWLQGLFIALQWIKKKARPPSVVGPSDIKLIWLWQMEDLHLHEIVDKEVHPAD